MELRFQSYGAGEPLIILHGLFGSLDNWRSISAKLAAHFHVLAVDQRNHGHSPHGEEMDYAAMSEDLGELLIARQFPWAHVLGHSMGGKTAMTFALSYPQQVGKLIIADMAPRSYPPHHANILEALLALPLGQFRTRQQIDDALASSIPELPVRRFLLKNLTPEPTGGFRWRIGLREIHQNYAHLGEAISVGPPFEGPTLFIRGERSDYLRKEDLPTITTLFPRAELRTIPGAGHLVHVENPAAFLCVVLKFLSSAEPPGPSGPSTKPPE